MPFSWRFELVSTLLLASTLPTAAMAREAVSPSRGDGPGTAHSTHAVPDPTPVRVSKDDYLSFIERFVSQHTRPRLAWLRQRTPGASTDACLEAAEHYAFFHAVTGDEEDAERAVAFVELAYRLMRMRGDKGAPHWRAPLHLHRIWRRLAASPALTDDVREQMRALMVAAMPRFPERYRTYSPNSRAMGYGLIGQILLEYVPDVPEAASWRAYVDRVWTEFRRFDDSTNNTGNYDAAFLLYLVDWIELRSDEEEVYADADIRRLFERYMLQVLPIGTLPHYGDTTGWNVEWGHWIRIFETAGAKIGDGRYRWAAHRIFAYGTSRIEDVFSWSYTGSRAVESLMGAHLVADASIEAMAPGDDLVLVERRGIERGPGGPRPFTLRADRVPSKLVFRSSAAVDSTAFLIDLAPAASHNDPPMPTALVALVDEGSVLLMDQGYDERATLDHNMLWLEDYEGFPLSPQREKTKVLEQGVVGPLLHAVVRVEQYRGYPVDLERTVVFAREGVILLVDEVHFRRSFEARIGPGFNLRNLGPGPGPDWVDTDLGERIPVRGIGKGKPVLARWKNPSRRLLIHFRPIPGGDLHVADRSEDDPTIPLPHRLQYRARVAPEAGRSVSFATVLLPHDPARPPSEIAARILFAGDPEVGSTAVRVLLDDGRSVWLSAGPVETSRFTSDADAAVIVVRGDRVESLGVARGSRLEVGGAAVLDEATRGDRSR